MRQIFLDTETTGLDPAQSHRIIEVAAIEVVNRRPTGNSYHQYINPDREIDPGAQAVHGISLEQLQDKPRFCDVAGEFLDFIASAELVIHNAPFDIAFLNSELGMLDKGTVSDVCAGIVDTLKMAKELHPGQRNNLDALCKRYGIDNSNRTLHGALLDAELLVDVYIAMTRGQESLMMDIGPVATELVTKEFVRQKPLVVINASIEETQEHQAYLAGLDQAEGTCIWLQLKAN